MERTRESLTPLNIFFSHFAVLYCVFISCQRVRKWLLMLPLNVPFKLNALFQKRMKRAYAVHEPTAKS